jgi:hypothetical protein
MGGMGGGGEWEGRYLDEHAEVGGFEHGAGKDLRMGEKRRIRLDMRQDEWT